MVCRSGFRGIALALSACSVLALGATATATASERPRPSISVESGDGASRLWVDVVLPGGTAHRRLLRETSAAVRPMASGWGPTGRAGFTTWEESDAPWFSYSRDAGETWSEARPLSVELRLRDGEVAPDDRMPDAPARLTLPPGGGVYLVQLKTISLPEWRAALESAGAELLAYLPDNAHVVRLVDAPAARVEALAGLDMVERVEPYHPWYRLSAELRAWIEEPGDATPERMRVRVMAFDRDAETKARISAAAGDTGAVVVESAPRGVVVELDVNRDQLARIAALDDVQWIDPWAAAETDMDLVREDSGADWLESNFLSGEDNLGYCGQGVRGEVMDLGIHDDHPDFDGIQLHPEAHSVYYHGTGAYGVVFGNGDRDGDGEAQATGHLPCGQGIFADRDDVSDRFAHTRELKEAPYLASFQTNSWGNGLSTSYTSYTRDLDDIIWQLDIAIVQSQSNQASRSSRPQAWAKNVISVGGIRHGDNLDPSDDFWCRDGCEDYTIESSCEEQTACKWHVPGDPSSYCRPSCASIGPAEDGRVKPDVHYWYDHIYTTYLSEGYFEFGGTSAATPEVAGVLGLMLQMWKENVWGTDHPPETTVFDAQPHFSTLKALLINNARQYPFDGEAHDLSRHKQGWGRPSVRVAAERAANSFIVDQDLLLEVGELATYRIEVALGESHLKVTMVYPDPPGNPASSMARVNDLDLRVISPSGDVYHGNVGLTAENASVPGGATNRIDTVENVFVVDPEPGTWSVAIEAAEINEDACPEGHESICGPTPGGTQEADATFSLVVTGGTGTASCTAPTAGFSATPNPAQVGDTVQFQSNVSGGSGGPYAYWWDFDGDGVADSTEQNPVHVYARPFDWPAKLWVADAANCPVTVRETVAVTGPDLWYDGYVNLTEVVGNGNGGIDPGETWELTVNLRNDGNESGEDVSADLLVDPASPVSVSLLQAGSAYPDIAVGEAAPSVLAYRFQVDGFAPCGESISLNLTATASSAISGHTNTYPTEVGVIRLFVGGTGPAVSIFPDGFEEDLGWTESIWAGSGEWERGEPLGLGGSWPDPDAAYDGRFVLGNDLTGQGTYLGSYESDVGSDIRSPWIDTSGYRVTEVEFARWLNVTPGDYAAVYVEGPPGGLPFTRLESWSGVTEDSWTPTRFDLSNLAAGASRLQFRFRADSGNQDTASGWNIDAFDLLGIPLDSCEPWAPAVRYDSHGGLTEIEGNGNAVVEPGETWEISVLLRNDGVFPAGGVSANLTIDPATPDSVFLLQDRSDYGTIDPGEAVASISAYRFRLGDDFPCGGEVVLSVTEITSTDPSGSYADEAGVIRIPVGEFGTLFPDDFETDTGWDLDFVPGGEWEIGSPRGLGAASPDPQTAYGGQRVLGNDLTGHGSFPGDYENDVWSKAKSPTFNVSGTVDVTLEFVRWLNLSPGDSGLVQIHQGGIYLADVEAWRSTESQPSWVTETISLSPHIPEGTDTLEVVFALSSDSAATSSGWNIDDLEVTGVTCEQFMPYLRYDSYGGLAEIEGNGDGAVDAGEIWELTVNLRNDGNRQARQVSAEVAVDPATPGAVTMLRASSTYPDIHVDQIASSDPTYSFQIAPDFPCGGEIVLSVTNISSDDPQASYPDEVGVITVPVACPVLRYHSFAGLTEVQGNGDAAVDPGEAWDLTINLRNDGDGQATGVSANVEIDTSTPGTVFVLQGSSDYGAIDPGQVVPSNGAYRLRLASDFPCGGEIVLSVTDISSTAPMVGYPDEVGVISIPVGERVTLFPDDFETDKGWDLDFVPGGEWEIDAPRGLGASSPDPGSAHGGQRVLGNDLTGQGDSPGEYENNVWSKAKSPTFDVSDAVDVTLEFVRWLNLSPGDRGHLQIHENGIYLADVKSWDSGDSQSSWVTETVPLSPDIPDGTDTLEVVFALGSDADTTNSGWNIDDLEVTGVRCETFQRSLPGEAMQLMVAKGPPGYLTLQWSGDCGGATTYGIYRGDLTIGYDSIAAEPGMCDVTATVQDIPEGSGDAEFFLVVPHGDGEEGSYGADSSGTPRPPAVGGCYPQSEVDVCAP